MEVNYDRRRRRVKPDDVIELMTSYTRCGCLVVANVNGRPQANCTDSESLALSSCMEEEECLQAVVIEREGKFELLTASDMQAEEEEEVKVDRREQEKSQSNATAEQVTSNPAELAEAAQTPGQDASCEGLQHTAELQDRQSVARKSQELCKKSVIC